jgi:hypothetical protein
VELGRFFSFLIYSQSVRLLDGGWARQNAATHTHRTTQTHTDIHSLNEIRTHDPSVRAGKDSSCLRPRGSSPTILVAVMWHVPAISYLQISSWKQYAGTSNKISKPDLQVIHHLITSQAISTRNFTGNSEE